MPSAAIKHLNIITLFSYKIPTVQMRRGKRLTKVNILPSHTAIKWQNWDVNPATKPELFNFQNRFIPTLPSPGLVTNT